ncbi:putative MFS family arabinose efflux permease [Hamadaea flava]|uniref:MFS transporter n=1 Tax=Hamadaea flava TaxID=1742688 RepID=A0ABV8LT64_9ACTN|nr:MFS transporter [Hamadaea flava]MCP2328012.1 putative MFS family arabinose efflux permease [Hamadaea flava]
MTTLLEPEAQRATYREVLADPIYRLLFVTRSLAIAADSLRILALSVLIYTTTSSPLLGALAFGAGFLPQLFGSTLFGSLADRVRPRFVIFLGYAVECVSAVLLATVPLPAWACLVLVAVIATFVPVFGGASARVIAETLTGDAYVLGRALSSMSASAAQLVGLAGGGAAIAALGSPQHALLVSAVLHAIAAVVIRLRMPNLAAVPAAAGSVLKHSWQANRTLLGDQAIRRLMFAQWLPPAFSVGAEGLLVAYAAERDFPAGTAGYLLACLPVGMFAGDLVVGRFVTPRTRERLAAPLVLLLGVPLALLGFEVSVAVAAALLFLSGAGFAYTLGLQRSFVDALPEAMRGQAFGMLSSGLMTAQGLGPAVFGAVALATGATAAVALAGAAAAGCAVIVSVSRTRPPAVRHT